VWPSRALFVAPLNPVTVENDLMTFAASYGSVDSVIVIRHLETQQSKRYGFIYMQTVEDAWKVSQLHY